MGILKAAAKVVGTVTLAATGTASAILKGVSDTLGVELGSEIFTAAKDASFKGIHAMWDDGSEQRTETLNRVKNSGEYLANKTRQQMANTAKRAAAHARKNGDEKLYEKYMAQYEQYCE